MSLFDTKTLIKVIFTAFLAQMFAVLDIVQFHNGFTIIEFTYSIAAFFLAPFLFIAAKRFVGLNVRELLKQK